MVHEAIFYDLKKNLNLMRSLSSQVAREIGRKIVSGKYHEGTLIEDENYLSEKFKVSRAVVRDAAKILVGKGLITIRRGIGTTVMPRSNWSLLDDDVIAWHLSSPLTEKQVYNLLELRMTIEPAAAWWAAERADSNDINQLEKYYKQMKNSTSSVDDYIKADALFHSSILDSSHNEYLIAFENLIFSSLLMSIRLTNIDFNLNKKSLPLHKKIIENIKNKNPKKAKEQMITHLKDTEKRLKELFDMNNLNISNSN